MAKTRLGRLTVDVMMRTSGIERGTKESRKRFRELNKTVEKYEKTIKASMVAAGVAVVGFATLITKTTLDSIKLISTQADLADSMNATVTGIRAVNQAAADNSIGELDSSLNRLNRRLGAAERGAGPAVAAIKNLNLNIDQLARADADEKLALIADAIQKSGVSSQAATRYLQDLGFEQQGVYNLFRDGGDAIRGYREQIEETGRAVNAIEAIQIQEANKALASMGDSADGVKTKLAIELAPIIGELAKDFQTWSDTSVGGVSNINKALDDLIDFIEPVGNAVQVVGRASVYLFHALRTGIDSVITWTVLLGDALLKKVTGSIRGIVEAANWLGKAIGVNIGAKTLQKLDEIEAKSSAVAESFKSSWVDATLESSKAMEDSFAPLTFGRKAKEYAETARKAARESAEVILAERQAASSEASAIEETSLLEQYEMQKGALERQLEMLRIYGEDEAEILLLQYQQRELGLKEQLEKNELTEEQYRTESLHAWEVYHASLGKLEEKAQEDRQRGIAQMFGNLARVMNAGSRKLFEIGKISAIGEAIVAGKKAAIDAYKWGMAAGGPPLASAARIASMAATGADILSIKKTKYGSSSTSSVSAAAESIDVSPQQPTQNVSMTLTGVNPSDWYSGDQIVDLVNTAVDNGAVIKGFA